MSANDIQIGGSHYKDMGQFQPWDVLRHWMTEEEYRGWMKGSALVYLARERSKGSNEDLRKALHTLTKLVEITAASQLVTLDLSEEPEESKPRRKYVKKTSTKAAPYGFKPDGTPRKYKPKGWKE
jgi:hypothetical protein